MCDLCTSDSFEQFRCTASHLVPHLVHTTHSRRCCVSWLLPKLHENPVHRPSRSDATSTPLTPCLAARRLRYFERQASSLERKAGQEARLLAAAVDAEARGKEAQRRLAALAPRVSELVLRTRHIKSETEKALSRLFAGRRVNVLGDINTVLSSTGL